MPTFNSVALAERCLTSILDQKGICAQIIVSDDSTVPGVEDLVQRLRATYPAICYAPGARTGNPVDNWNVGLDLAQGRYSLLVHHDEVLTDPGYLRRAVDRLDAHRAQVLLTGHSRAGGSGRSRFGLASTLARWLRLGPWTLYLINWIGPTASVAFATDLAPRFDPRLVWLVDVDFYARLLAQAQGVVSEREVSVISQLHPDQISARIDGRALAPDEIRRLGHDTPPCLSPGQYRLALAYHALRRTRRIARYRRFAR